MNCFEFKKIALSDPQCREASFVEHSAECPDCLKYIGSVRQMDADLGSSLNVEMPSDLVARLQLNTQISVQESSKSVSLRNYAMAASFAIALFVAGFIASNQLSIEDDLNHDYQALLSAVVDHMHEDQITPVWSPERANRTTNTLLASYDGALQFKYLDTLQFSKICPLGQYRGLHASIETDEGQVTFAYIKGDSVGDLLDASYQGYASRIKPVRGGNLVILSKTQKAVNQADSKLEDAMYWDI